MTEMQDFQLQMTQMLEASCLFSFKSILLHTSGKCQSINSVYVKLYIVSGAGLAQFLALKNTTTDPSCLGYIGSWLGACMAVWVININNNYNSEIRTVTVLLLE